MCCHDNTEHHGRSDRRSPESKVIETLIRFENTQSSKNNILNHLFTPAAAL